MTKQPEEKPKATPIQPRQEVKGKARLGPHLDLVQTLKKQLAAVGKIAWEKADNS